MPIERRLRTGLNRNADILHSDVDRFLGVVQRKARRRVLTRRAVAGLAVAAAVAAVVVAGPRALEAIGDATRTTPATTQHHQAPSPTGLSGTFSRTVGPSGAAAQASQVAGQWVMRIEGGTIDPLIAPSSFTGLVTPFQYSVRGSVFRTNLFVGDLCLNKPAGTYRWSITGNVLRFVTVSDACQARAALLTSGPWQKTL